MANQQAQDLRRVYYHIIDDVVTKMKPEFVQENVDESVLHTIRQRWAQKLTERGIISETEPEETKREVDKDSQLANNARKRPHDGAGPSGPILKQEPNANPAAAVQQQPQHLMQPNAAMLQHQRQLPQAAMTHQQLQQLQQQQRLHAGVPLQQRLAAQAAAGVPGMQQRMQGVQMAGALQGLPGGLAGLPTGVQLPAGSAVPANNLQLGMQGLVRMQQQQQQQGVAGMPAVQGLQGNLAQLQQLLAQNPALAQQLRAQQQQVLQAQQQVLQAQQQRQQQQQFLAQQQQLAQQQRQQQQVYNNTIPQRDGACDDVPAPLAAVAATAGVNAQQLHALLPPQLSSALAAAHKRCSSGSNPPAALQTATTGSAAAVAEAAGGGGSSSTKAHGTKQQCQQQRRRQRCVIPQVDGNGDDDDDGFDEEEEDVVEEFEEVEVPAEEPQADSDDNEDDIKELKSFEDDLARQEAADAEAIENVGFALYEKVQRSKNRWRCTLKYGVFYINGKEYMFNKAMTDLTF